MGLLFLFIFLKNLLLSTGRTRFSKTKKQNKNNLDQFLTLENAKIGPVFNSTAYIYRERERKGQRREDQRGWISLHVAFSAPHPKPSKLAFKSKSPTLLLLSLPFCLPPSPLAPHLSFASPVVASKLGWAFRGNNNHNHHQHNKLTDTYIFLHWKSPKLDSTHIFA